MVKKQNIYTVKKTVLTTQITKYEILFIFY